MARSSPIVAPSDGPLRPSPDTLMPVCKPSTLNRFDFNSDQSRQMSISTKDRRRNGTGFHLAVTAVKIRKNQEQQPFHFKMVRGHAFQQCTTVTTGESFIGVPHAKIELRQERERRPNSHVLPILPISPFPVGVLFSHGVQ